MQDQPTNVALCATAILQLAQRKLRTDPARLYVSALRAIHPLPLMPHQDQLTTASKRAHELNEQKLK